MVAGIPPQGRLLSGPLGEPKSQGSMARGRGPQSFVQETQRQCRRCSLSTRWLTVWLDPPLGAGDESLIMMLGFAGFSVVVAVGVAVVGSLVVLCP